MPGALVYLTVRSIRNGVVTRLRRLRQPRYLIIAVGVLFYLATMISNRSRTGVFRVPDGYEDLARVVAAVVFFAIMAAAWILPASASLRFSLPEVTLLFPAPFERRTLLQYKIVHLLLGAAGSALFFMLFLGPTRPAAAALFAVKTAVILSVLGLIEAGVSLYRLNARQSIGARAKIRIPVLVASVVLMALAAWTLAIFAFVDTGASLLRVAPVIALLVFASIVWILGSDAAFEEEASINADKVRAAVGRLQKGQPRVTVRRGTPYRLAPTGPVELAILWKNWLLFGRASRTWIAGVAAIIVMFVVGFAAAGRAVPLWEAVPFLLFFMAGAAVFMGPMMVRSDLRRDLAYLPVIKTWPVAGAAIVRGEVLAPTIALSLGALAGLVPGALFAPPMMLSSDTVTARLSLVAAASMAAVSLILTQVLIQNAIAVIWPAWIRIRAGGAGAGVEGMGQMLIVMYGGLFVLLLAALVPASVAAIVMLFAGGILLPAVLFSLLMLVECFAATEIIGRILDRTDLQDL